MSHSLATTAASCSLQVSNLVGKPIVLTSARSPISSASEAALDRTRFVYETEWQVISRHSEPQSPVLGRASLRQRQPTLVLSRQDARALEFSMIAELLAGHATSKAFCAMATCAIHTACLQAMAANAGRGAAAELLATASEQVSCSTAGVRGSQSCSAAVLGIQSMQRVAAMEFGMIQFASVDVCSAFTVAKER